MQRREVSRLCQAAHAATASLRPGLVVRLLRTPHLLIDPTRDKMEDRLLLENTERERSAGAGFGVLGWDGEGGGVEGGPVEELEDIQVVVWRV
jgi:hypothetical protein